jgi:chromosomal replication initiation ATPase DnaA
MGRMRRKMAQLALDLPYRPAFLRDDFLVTDSNRVAVEWLDGWKSWSAPALVLTGPAASGKTHLAHVWQNLAGAAFWAKETEVTQNLIIDNVDDLLADAAEEEPLLHLYNQAREGGFFLLLTSRKTVAQIDIKLPDLASRLKAAPTVPLGPPDDALLEALLLKQFSDRQLRITPDVLAFLLPRIGRTADALRDVVERLDGSALEESRAITVPFARRILAAYMDKETGDHA